MFKKLFLTLVLPGSAMLFAQEGVLKIQVADSLTGEALEAASVVVESAGAAISSRMTDSTGIIVFKNLASGAYNIKGLLTGYQKNMLTGVIIKNNETTYLDILLSSKNIINDFVITEYRKPLINPNTEIKTTFLHDELETSTYKGDINALLSTVPGAVQTQEGMTPRFRGAREGSVVYIIDGQRTIGSTGVPFGGIEQVSVTLGGIPAKYGDGTGAFIEIETRSGLVNPHR